jgi:hypothetical protein
MPLRQLLKALKPRPLGRGGCQAERSNISSFGVLCRQLSARAHLRRSLVQGVYYRTGGFSPFIENSYFPHSPRRNMAWAATTTGPHPPRGVSASPGTERKRSASHRKGITGFDNTDTDNEDGTQDCRMRTYPVIVASVANGVTDCPTAVSALGLHQRDQRIQDGGVQ